jgi:ice-binding like protein
MKKVKVATLTTSNLSRLGGAFLLGSMSLACGSSTGTTPVDQGTSGDGGSSGGSASSGGAGGMTDGMTSVGSMDAPGSIDAVDAENVDVPLSPGAVNLGTAGDFVILSKSGISTVPTSAVTGNLGVSPAAATYITGFSLTADRTNVFSMSPQVTGKVYASNYSPPTPANLTTAIGDMMTALTDAAGRAPSVTELGAGNIGGMTLAPGVYRWGTALLIPTNVTLTGSASDVWIFQIAKNLTMSSATNVFLTGGAVAKNVFWEVAGSASLGTTAHFEGILLCQTSVALATGASINGRLLAQTAVSIEGSTVVEPAP